MADKEPRRMGRAEQIRLVTDLRLAYERAGDKKLDWLCNEGKLMKRKVAQGNVYWHISIEHYKKKTLTKAMKEMIRTDGEFDED